jgi:DNA-binding CsgD family transcriptional regulator
MTDADSFLVVVSLSGSSEGSTHRCTGQVVVGRGEGSGIVLPHPLVSRRHASFELSDLGLIVVSDLGGRNGTRVGETLLRDSSLSVEREARVQIEPFSLLVRADPDSDYDTITLSTLVEMERPNLADGVAASGTITLLCLAFAASEGADAKEREVVERIVAHHNGHTIKALEAGSLHTFHSTRNALRCAVGLQEEFGRRGLGHPNAPMIGVHTAELAADPGGFFVSHVRLAAQIAEEAAVGEILVSDAVHALAASSDDVHFDQPRSIEPGEPGAARRIYRVLWRATDTRDEFPDGLTAREVQVLELLAAGLSNQEIADALVISRHTVIRHVNHIYSKISVTNRAGATRYAVEQGLRDR